jgi:23S rRNA (adenine1618-N6)-methyltransferase
MKTNPINEKTNLHPRNQHRLGYNFEQLIAAYPQLQPFVTINEHGIDPRDSPQPKQTIDFSNPKAVKALNKALLIADYDILNWDIPPHYLCPPIPGRVDYIHYVADLLALKNDGIIPEAKPSKCLTRGLAPTAFIPF